MELFTLLTGTKSRWVNIDSADLNYYLKPSTLRREKVNFQFSVYLILFLGRRGQREEVYLHPKKASEPRRMILRIRKITFFFLLNIKLPDIDIVITYE